jgi:hypothetical protein
LQAVIKDYDQGNTIVGGMFTAVNRSEQIFFLNKAAYSGSLDFQHSWKNRWWSFKANLIMSYLEGNKESILATQTISSICFSAQMLNILEWIQISLLFQERRSH